jgi:hypothetical protein
MGNTKLWVSVDRFGIMRPTKQVPNFKLEPTKIRTEVSPGMEWEAEGRALEDKDSWRTVEAWAHWDLNPCKESM